MEKTKKKRQSLMPPLPMWEISIYTAAWVTLISCAAFSAVSHLRTIYKDYEDNEDSDPEWDVLTLSVPFLSLHFIGAQWLRKYRPNGLPAFYFLIGAVWIGWLVGVKGLAFLLIQPLALFLVKLMTGSDKMIYIMAVTYAAIQGAGIGPISLLKGVTLGTDKDSFNRFVGHITESWINLRAMSCCLDLLWQDVPSSGIMGDFSKMLAHSFYMPVLVLGPIIRFKEFNDGLERKRSPWDMKRIRSFGLLLLRFFFWWLIALLLWPLNISARSYVAYDMEVTDSMWTICGIGYLLGQLFHLKYVVFYGLPRAFYLADGIEDIPAPKCISRISHYSDMWRYFDVGLYKFIQKYFYLPLIVRYPGALTKLLASLFTFCFVCVFHGLHEYVLIWSALNFLGVTLEAVGKSMCRTEAYKRMESVHPSPASQRRLNAMGSTLVFNLALTSNLYFLTEDATKGNLFAYRFTCSWAYGTPLFLLTLYFGAQFSYEVRNWENSAKSPCSFQK